MATLHTTLTRNTTTIINVGTSATDGCVVIRYSCTRGALAGAGIIAVLNEAVPVEPYHAEFFDDVGITAVAADINAGNLRLKITLDSGANDITFNYNKTIIKS
jgi:hypothetical protein